MKPKLYPLAGGCVLVWITILTSALSAWAASGDRPGWNESVLYSFQGPPDGSDPAGGVIFGKDGNLYGATYGGGNGVSGTVFQLTPPAQKGGSWTETVLHSFQGHPTDGDIANGGLVSDPEGNLYGVAAYGGSGNCVLFGGDVGCGIVYKMTPPALPGGAWSESVIYSFQGGKDGYVPWGDLTFDAKGNLYGATYYGGGYGSCNSPYYQYCGTIFELSPPQTKSGKWKERVLYRFKGVAAGAQFGDGANPNGGLVLDGTGAIYGTTYFGGNNVKGQCQGGVGGTGCGIVFKLTPPNQKGGKWTEKALHQFDGQDGSNSAAGVVFDRDGNLYGTTSGGPQNGYGLIFELKTPSGKIRSWTETLLHLFSDGNDGAYPMAGLILDPQGNLYGAALGGATHAGVIFRLKPPKRGNSWPLTVLYNLLDSPDGDHPTAGLSFDSGGNLYSTTEWGGTGQSCQGGCGTVFQVMP
jgi:hypothetical protein